MTATQTQREPGTGNREPEIRAVEMGRERVIAHDVVLVARLADWRRAQTAAERLRGEDLTVWVPWEEEPRLEGTVAAWENLDPESPVAAKAHGALMQVKMGCLLAIQAARCLVICQPAGADCHIQAGYAQARGVPIVILDLNATVSMRTPDHPLYRRGVLSFDWPLARDMDALVHWVQVYARELPARRIADAKGEGVPLAVLGSGDDRRVIEGR